MNTKFEELQAAVKTAGKVSKFTQLSVAVKAAALGVQPTGQALGAATNVVPPVQSPAPPATAPAAQGADQLAPVTSSTGVSPAPAVAPQGPAAAPNMPPAAMGGGSAPPASQEAQLEAEAAAIDQQVAQGDLRAKKIDGQAKLVGSKAKEVGAQEKLLANQLKLQEAQVSAQQSQSMLGAPGAQPAAAGAPGGKFAELQGLIKGAAQRKPYTVKEAAVKVRLYAAKVNKYASTRDVMADISSMAEVYIRDIPEGLIKRGSELDPLSETHPCLLGFGLASEGSGKLIDMINQRSRGRARQEKIAKGDLAAYRDVLRRGVLLHNAIVKMAATITNVMELEREKTGLSAAAFITKLAMDRLAPKRLVLKQLASISDDRQFRKEAAANEEVKADTLDEAIASLEKIAGDGGDLVLTRTVLSRQPELRKAANVAIFDQAGASALIENDTDTLAKCVVGLALEGRFGTEAYLTATR